MRSALSLSYDIVRLSVFVGEFGSALWQLRLKCNMTNAILAALVAASLLVGGTWACSEDSDCSLNGVCSAGVCECDIPWEGPSCAVLGLLPAKPHAGYGQVTGPMNVSSWGGSIIRGEGEDNGTWHMIVSEMVGYRCGLHVWQSQSSIVHATATSPEGPYSRAGLVVPHQAHNPQVVFADGSYFLFHIGTGCNGGRPKSCNETWKGDWPPAAPAGKQELGRAPIPPRSSAASGCVGSILHRSTTPAGPWTPVTLSKDANFQHCDNPAPYVHPNGTIFVVCSRTWTIRSAAHPEGPWTDPILISGIGGMNQHNVTRKWEDPFLWTDRRGNFHILSHTWTPELYPFNSISGHAFSPDGLTWTSSPIEPYNSTVHFSDGSSHYFSTMERPKLVFGGADGRSPLYISNGVSPVGAPCTGCGHCSHCKVSGLPQTAAGPEPCFPPCGCAATVGGGVALALALGRFCLATVRPASQHSHPGTLPCAPQSPLSASERS